MCGRMMLTFFFPLNNSRLAKATKYASKGLHEK
jgi:hypothetical protein